MIWHSPGGFTYLRHPDTLDIHDYIEHDGTTYEVLDVISDRIDSDADYWYRVVSL